MTALAETRGELEKRFESLVEDAYQAYLKSAEPSQKDFNNPPITSANALLRLVRDQNENFQNFRNRERKLIDVVGSLLKPIEVIGGIVAGGAEDVFPPSQHIFSAVMYLVGAAGDVSDMYDAILNLFVRLQDFTILAALFETLLIATEEVNRGRVKAYFRKVFGRESKVPEALAKLDSLTKGEEGLVMAETLASIKRTLSLQHRLAEELESLHDAFYGKQILRKLQSRDDIKTIPSAVRSLINTPSTADTRIRNIYLFLDGVDEAEKPEVEELLSLLADLPERYQTTRVQIALIGRNVLTETVSIYLDEDGSSRQLRTIQLTPEILAEDVRLYIIDEVRRSRVLRRTLPRFKEEVVEKMTKQVDGLFILARIMISDLNRKSHPRMILQSLAEFPREINGTLYKMMEQLSATLSEDHAADLNEALIWVACAEQTLTLEQMETILELRFGDPAFNLEETLHNMSTNVKAKTGGPAIGFDLVEARIHVLKTCLHILVEPKMFRRNPRNGPMWQYVTWYWQEHLVSVDKSRVSRKDKEYIGRCLYKLLTRQPSILDWTQEEESLKLFTDPNMDCLQRWMSDTEVLSGLDEESRDWAIHAASKPGGLVERIGRIYAQAWLDPSFGQYIPTMTCFQIVHSVAYIQDGHTWDDSDFEWSSIPPRVRMRRALGWSNMPETAHSLRRVGSTYLNLGLHDEALKLFTRALPLDGNMVETCGRIAYCYMKNRQYDRALVYHLTCEVLENRLISSRKFTARREIDFSRWRLYTNRLQIAKCLVKLNRVIDSIPYFQMAIKDAYEPEKFEPEEAYLDVLAGNNRHELIMELLDKMDSLSGSQVGESRLIDFLVAQASGTSDSEWIIPKTACIRGRTETMISRYQIAIDVTERKQDTGAQLNLRLSLASLKFFSRDYIGALAVLDEISSIGGHPRGSVLVRTLYALSMRSRAQVYKQMIIASGVQSAAAGPLLGKLEELQGGQTKKAQSLLSAIIIESIAILNDEEPQNDSHALENLSRALVAIGDIDDAIALFQSTRRFADWEDRVRKRWENAAG
ncbi:unnamed protein product [Parascedosporium putredinis]|uniref:Fungal STAND N-terminal Goodbye domain-containing protein n=1 Tax=Parascedosporium putredinis TaxID=1442378 RepID=A0A9P1GXG6_9PEZI|nr:unnamed protein product [Parascedosporium putredinis]CAI7988991.1 unnamed protein product [Parascedosporium putredinis]